MRYSAVWNTLLREAPNVDHEKITNLMSTKYPFGPCCHFYRSGMGTLRSMIFDVTDKKLKVSFGPPDMKEWHSFDFDEPVGIQEVVCEYEDVVSMIQNNFGEKCNFVNPPCEEVGALWIPISPKHCSKQIIWASVLQVAMVFGNELVLG